MMKLVGWALVLLFSLLALAVFVVIGRHAWSISAAIVEGAKTLEPAVYVPLTVTLVTATLGLAATLISQYRVRKREIEAAHRERKIEIYLEFLKTLESVILSAKPELAKEEVDENEVARRLLEVRTKAVLWGSTGVLRELGNLQHFAVDGSLNIVDVMDKLQREMRKDIGLSNFGLDRDFFVKLLLSNPQEIDELRRRTRENAQSFKG